MKRLSFILALIIALSGMIGLFATPAYAASTPVDLIVMENGDNDMSSTTYSTVGSALEAANGLAQNTVYIRVDADTAETFNNAPITKNIVVYSDNATAPTLTATTDVADNTHPIDATKYGGLFDMNGGSLTLENLNITTGSDNYCAVYFNATSTAVGTLTINNCSIDTVGRSIHINSATGVTFTEGVNISVNNSTIKSAKNPLQHNARTANTSTTAVISFNNVAFDASAGGVQVQNVYADINFTNCSVKEGGALKQLVYSSTKGTVHTLDVVGCDITTTDKTVSYANTADGTNFNFVDSVLKSPKYVVHVAHTGTNLTTLGTFNFVNCDLECTSTNYIVAIDPASKTGADIKAVMNVYSGTYKTAGKGFLNNDKDAKINVYGGNFINTSTNAFIMGGNTKAYFYGGTIDAELPFATNNVGQQATDVQEIVNGNVHTFLPANVAVNKAVIDLEGAQLLAGTTAESATTAARFVAKLTAADLSQYSEVGYYISKVNASVASEGDYIVKKSSESVYTSIKAGNSVYEAATGSYIILAELTGISNADFGDVVYVRAYAKMADGNIIVSDVQEFSVAKALAN